MESGVATLAQRQDQASATVPIGLDLGAETLSMAVPGLRSVITAEAAQYGGWNVESSVPLLWLAPQALDDIAAREVDAGATAAAVVAVPGWFSVLDRAAIRTYLAGGRHSVSLVGSTHAAIVGWLHANGASQPLSTVLCLDQGVGLSVSVAVLGADGPHEVASAALAPRGGLEPGSQTRIDAITGLVGHVLRLARASGVTHLDAAIAVVGAADDPLALQWSRVLDALHGPGELSAQWVGVARREVVGRGAALLAGQLSSVGSVLNLESSAHRLGVIIEGERGLEVLTLVPAGRLLPLIVEQSFAADGGAPVRFDLVEARRPGASADPRDWDTIATATWIDAVRADRGTAPRQVEIQLTLDSDGVVAIGPSDRWQVVVGSGVVELMSHPMPTSAVLGQHGDGAGQRATTGAHDAARVRTQRFGAAAVEPPSRSLAWPPDVVPAAPVAATWPPPTPPIATTASAATAVGCPEVERAGEVDIEARRAAEELVRAVAERLMSERSSGRLSALDDDALEEIARAEIGAPSLPSALADLERHLSRHVGMLLGVRSIPALLDCDDDAEVHELRARALRLEAALDGQPDDDLTRCVRAAVRAARRTFTDDPAARFVGGTSMAIAADAVAVVDHLRLMVGEVQAAEHRRLLLDARLRGLSASAASSLIAGLLGDLPEVESSGHITSPPVRDAVARVGEGHRGWSLEAHTDPAEPVVAETRPGLAQIRVLLIEQCCG